MVTPQAPRSTSCAQLQWLAARAEDEAEGERARAAGLCLAESAARRGLFPPPVREAGPAAGAPARRRRGGSLPSFMAEELILSTICSFLDHSELLGGVSVCHSVAARVVSTALCHRYGPNGELGVLQRWNMEAIDALQESVDAFIDYFFHGPPTCPVADLPKLLPLMTAHERYVHLFEVFCNEYSDLRDTIVSGAMLDTLFGCATLNDRLGEVYKARAKEDPMFIPLGETHWLSGRQIRQEGVDVNMWIIRQRRMFHDLPVKHYFFNPLLELNRRLHQHGLLAPAPAAIDDDEAIPLPALAMPPELPQEDDLQFLDDHSRTADETGGEEEEDSEG
eukprot:TRINITY_DN50732_c0_g1_i1.p1 TRINITY_DN50732_c0_g1~~TRINITY_DN50732_c0_g1_i1.p1  ORF type:complete len:357 (+),score=105.86 TRINITY_DN50732_c0_g1_i1:68-1072(+)